jgi:FlaG/FlaF family flagellin (archaellin)
MWGGFTDRGQSEVIGNILMVGVAVIVGITLAVGAFAMVSGNEVGPTAQFDFEYDGDTGGLVITHENGDTALTDRLAIEGGTASLSGQWPDEEASAGDSTYHYARPDQTVDIVWEKKEEGVSKILSEFTVPSGFQLTTLDWTPTGDDPVASFRQSFVHDPERGLHWDAQPGYVRVAQSGTDDSWLRYERVLPENDGSVELMIHFETDSFEGSGYKIGFVDTQGNVNLIWCNPSTNSHSSDLTIDCSGAENTDDTDSHTLDGSKDVTMSNDIARFFVVVDMENNKNSFLDEARFYEVSIDT